MSEIPLYRLGALTRDKRDRIPGLMEHLRRKHPTLDVRLKGNTLYARVVGTPKFVLPIKV